MPGLGFGLLLLVLPLYAIPPSRGTREGGPGQLSAKDEECRFMAGPRTKGRTRTARGYSAARMENGPRVALEPRKAVLKWVYLSKILKNPVDECYLTTYSKYINC